MNFLDMKPMQDMRNWFTAWAKKNSECKLAICFGSSGRGDATSSSDLDVAIVGQDLLKKISDDILLEFEDTLYYAKVDQKKVLFLVPYSSGIFRIDCFGVDYLQEIETFIKGSELNVSELDQQIVLHCNPITGLVDYEWLKTFLTNRNEVSESDVMNIISLNIKHFIDSFEVASNKHSIHDEFQYIFQLWISYTSLVKLEYVRRKGVHFLYLPKKVFSTFPEDVRFKFENELEPRGGLDAGKDLMLAYLTQFCETLTGLEDSYSSQTDLWNSIDMPQLSVKKIEKVLAAVLLRDDTLCDNNNKAFAVSTLLTPGKLYMSLFGDYQQVIRDNEISMILDLRTEYERILQPLQSSQASIPNLHIDVITCSAWRQGRALSYLQVMMSERGSLGLFFRTLLAVPVPVLLISSDRTAQAGGVVALLNWLCGASKSEVFRNVCTSCHGAEGHNLDRFLDDVGEDPVAYFVSLGLNLAEIKELKIRFHSNPESIGTPTDSFHNSSYQFITGQPPVQCRPFLACEISAMKYSMLANVPNNQQRPIAVFITGLPGSGKSTIASKLLQFIGLDISECVNIDMDIVRSFHSQYQSFRHQNGLLAGSLISYTDLVTWLNNGPTDIERLLYRDPDSIVRHLIDTKCHFVLPGVMQSEGTISFMKYCIAQGYKICLFGVHVEVETALRRATSRASLTGRYTPESLILDSAEAVKAWFALAADLVHQQDGDIVLCSNEAESYRLLFSSMNSMIQVEDLTLSSLYLSPALLLIFNEVRLKENQDICHPTSTAALSPVVSSSLVDEYKENGFVALRSCLSSDLVGKLGERFENSISDFASDNGLSREEYLSVVNKWPHCNTVVMDIMETLSPLLRHEIAKILNSAVAWPVGAILFRKAGSVVDAGYISTHPHQDISYARFPGSQMFRATSWIPIMLRNGDTLAFAKGSHKLGIEKVTDFLHPSHIASTPPVCDTIMPVALGDCLVFDARTWHASTPLSPTTGGGQILRLAIGIQWLTPGGLDGIVPGAYFRYPDHDKPETVDVAGMRKCGIFGMDTAGYFLKITLLMLVTHIGLDVNTASTIQMAEAICDPTCSTVVEAELVVFGCNYEQVITALRRYILFRRASRLHFGEAQGTKIFQPLYNVLIKQVLKDILV